MAIVDVDRLKRSGQKFASGFTPGQKVISVLGAIGLVFAMLMFTRWSASPDFAPLFSNLTGKDAGDITKALDGLGVKWKLADGGNTVLVPKGNVYTARVSLSSKGLPANADGYALLDHQGITTSEFKQRVDYQRAVQTELASTIMAIHGVSNATVNLTLPTDTPFVDASAKKAKASVQIDTGGTRLPNDQVQSIVHLVASAVKDLSPEDISITDTHGNDLYSGDAGSSFASAQNLSKQLAYQDSIERRLESMIAKSLGPGHAAVVVTATLDFSTGTTEATTLTPLLDKNGKQIKTDEQSHTTKYVTTGASSPTGILGPGTGTPTNDGTSTRLNENQGGANYANDIRTDHTTNQSPTIKNLSIAAGLDKNSVNVADLVKWKGLLSAAAGVDKARGDEIKVEAMTMDKATQAIAQAQFKNATTPGERREPLDLLAMVRYAVTLLIVGLVLFLAWRSVRRAQLGLGPARVPLDLAALEGGAVNGAGYANELAATLESELPRTAETRSLEPARTQLETEVTDLIERQPEDVAQTLRSWLADRRA